MGMCLKLLLFVINCSLQITRKYDQVDATAYLLEKTGDFQGALQLLLQRLDIDIKELVNTNTHNETQVRELTTKLMGLCQRGSATMDEQGRQSVWFLLLESLMQPQREATSRHVGMYCLKIRN